MRDLLFRFCFASYRYSHAYTPISHYTLPLGNPDETQHNVSPNAVPFNSIASAEISYPIYRSFTSPLPSLNTKPAQSSYYGSTLSFSPPLVASASKLLYTCRTFPRRPPPNLVPATREELLRRRTDQIARQIEGDPALGALRELFRQQSHANVWWMIDNDQLPPDIAALPGIDMAKRTILNIVGPWGTDDSVLAVGETEFHLARSNEHRETPLPYRGGWNEDGDDPQNRQWTKWELRDPSAPLPPRRRLRLPHPCKDASSIYDSLFWRLSLCGDPWNHQRGLLHLLEPLEVQSLALTASLHDVCARLRPGRPYKPGLLNGLFQGAFLVCPTIFILCHCVIIILLSSLLRSIGC